MSLKGFIKCVPQNSVLGPTFFNIYLNDLFYLTQMTQACSFADDTLFYVSETDLNTLINKLEHDTARTIDWLESNFIKLSWAKCHLLVCKCKHQTVWAKIGERII